MTLCLRLRTSRTGHLTGMLPGSPVSNRFSLPSSMSFRLIGYFSEPHVMTASPSDMIFSFTSSDRFFHSSSSVKSGSDDIPTIPETRSGRKRATTMLIHAPTPCPTSTTLPWHLGTLSTFSTRWMVSWAQRLTLCSMFDDDYVYDG